MDSLLPTDQRDESIYSDTRGGEMSDAKKTPEWEIVGHDDNYIQIAREAGI